MKIPDIVKYPAFQVHLVNTIIALFLLFVGGREVRNHDESGGLSVLLGLVLLAATTIGWVRFFRERKSSRGQG